MLTLETFKAYWDKQFPDLRLKRSHFLIAVSGGVDSVVLAHLMHTIGSKCTIAHVNFQLRGAESLRDETFVIQLGAKFNFPVEVHTIDTLQYAAQYKMGIQAAAREIRYAWFGALVQKMEPPTFLLTAHHADDQVETVLMQLFRGTGLHGLTGMSPLREDALPLARPLLPFTKEEIMHYAKENALSFVEDSSNSKDDYTRNLIRNQLLPQIEKVYPNAAENILNTVERIKEAEQIVKETVNGYWKKGIRMHKGIPHLGIRYCKAVIENDTYLWGLIQAYGFKPTQIAEVRKIISANNGAYITSSTHRIIKHNDSIQLVDNASSKEHFIIPIAEGTLQLQQGQLLFETISATSLGEINKEAHYAYLDADQVFGKDAISSLLYRTWQATDYFYPLGLRKKKKLNQFLSNLKLSLAVKEKIGVLTVGDKIIWVVGHRIDDRFKITPQTQRVLKITFLDTI
jgi:tRNA(Ile)-lysidine synthase